ncbi:D-alanyl-D-alanine carboxypeptidase family protein [Paenibacillus beijingensis]|uniref:Peptidase M15 n=1 Tax=Paenibacillus beijingensis TaxID=1126833 RepID=A0A0D5NQF7_9BACL|nr:D-alanyl-D-alanine carboxypeptidase family protein [Paenibacillus beijingensis]AJY77212.1 peptidase M15 [Paenibacillus beijingensis]
MARLKKPLAVLLLAGMTIYSAVQGSANAEPAQSAGTITTHAKAAALIDVESGRILYEDHGTEEMRIASLTKIMTAIVAIEEGKLQDVVKVGKRAVGKEGSSIYLQLGEEMTLHNMLYGLMLRSGNDAATAVAEHVGGSEEGFVRLMNEKAEWLGLANTRFMNPHGLDQDGHYSSAVDLAKLTAYALHNSVFSEIVATRVKTAPNPHDAWDYKWTNKNKMLSFYDGADGVKTGYTKTALRCLVSSATRGGQRLAAVTLNDGDDWADHQKLLDYGYHHYPLTNLAEKGQGVSGYSLRAGRTFRYPLAKDEEGAVSSRLVLLDSAQPTAAYRLGERGRIDWYLNGVKIGTVPVYETDDKRTKGSDKPALSRRIGGTFEWRQGTATLSEAFRSVVMALLRAGAG